MLFEDPEMYPCLLARLDQQPPKYVIYGYTWDVDGQRFRDYAAPIDRYIRSRYAIEDGVDGYEIWRRLEGLPAVDRQLRDRLPAATVQVARCVRPAFNKLLPNSASSVQ